MRNLFSNSRFYILLCAFLISGVEYLLIAASTPQSYQRIVRLDQLYAWTCVVTLYLTLLIGPLNHMRLASRVIGALRHARRALGVSAWYFAMLHVSFSFFGELHGFSGLKFLPEKYLVAVVIGCINLLILSLLAITSFDKVISLLSFRRWKLLQRLVYLAGCLIIIHAIMIGSHFTDLSQPIPQFFFVCIALLVLLQLQGLDILLSRKWPILPRYFITSIFIISIICVYIVSLFSPSENLSVFSIHSQHIQLAKLAQESSPINPSLQNIPGLTGDRTKRYTVSMVTTPQTILPHTDLTLRFSIFDASSGNPVTLYRVLYEKQMHMIIVNQNLTYFAHIHPTQQGNSFVITTQFPKDDLYHIYVTFQPFPAIEQQFAFTLPIGQITNESPSYQPDATRPKTFGDYQVQVKTNEPLVASKMSLGEEQITFTIHDAKANKPITNIKPYLGAFGHLTMINQKTYDFIHVHPSSLVIPKPDQISGPEVDFLPIGIYGPFKPGTYHAFAEFNIDNKVQMFDFTMGLK